MAGIPHPQDTVPVLDSLEFPGGPLPIDSQFYVERPPVEAQAFAEIGKPGSLVRIKAPRKMGKSSLMLRLIHRATALGYKVATVDFQQADTTIFSSLDKFLRWFCASVSRQLKLEPKLNEYWDVDMGSKVSCTLYFEEYILQEIETPIFLVLNEVNCVFEHPVIAQDFLPLLRFWHEQAKQDDLWEKVRLLVVHSTEIYISLNINQSPFNVGLPLKLLDFTIEQVRDLALRYGLSWRDSKLAEALMKMIGGHPYLVHLALYHLATSEMRSDPGEPESELEKLLGEAPTQSGIYSDYLRNHLTILQRQPELANAFQQVVEAPGNMPLKAVLAYQLNSMGLVKLEGNTCTLSCELYRLYFREQKLEESYHWEHLEKENHKLQILVNLDELTQISNRRYFDNCLKAEWKQMALDEMPLSLILCDLDRFKLYNDTYGHQAGDRCLQTVAQAIQAMLQRPSDLVARYGGEEFAIILPNTDATEAIEIAEKIRLGIKALEIDLEPPNFPGSSPSHITLSLGVACTIPGPENDAATLLLAADEALYESKRQGRDCVTLSSLLDFKMS